MTETKPPLNVPKVKQSSTTRQETKGHHSPAELAEAPREETTHLLQQTTDPSAQIQPELSGLRNIFRMLNNRSIDHSRINKDTAAP